MAIYISTVQGMNAQANKINNQFSPNTVLTYTGAISHQTRMARRGPKKTRVVSKQHIAFSFMNNERNNEYQDKLIQISSIHTSSDDGLPKED
jgi:hypothetical protein